MAISFVKNVGTRKLLLDNTQRQGKKARMAKKLRLARKVRENGEFGARGPGRVVKVFTLPNGARIQVTNRKAVRQAAAFVASHEAESYE